MDAILNGNSLIIPGKDPVKDNPDDVYNTPEIVVKSAFRDILPRHLMDAPERILDPGAGNGVWGIVARQHYRDAFIQGIELRNLPNPDANTYDRAWEAGRDFLSDMWIPDTDLVIGNPPYGATGGKRDRLLCEKFIRKGLSLLRPGGTLAFLLKTVYLEGIERGRGLFTQHRPAAVYVSSRRIHFRLNGKGAKGTNNVSYSLFVWENRARPVGGEGTRLYWWDYETGKVL